MTKALALGLCICAVILLRIPGDVCMEIIGGKEVAKHSRPYMALIKRMNAAVCGGALIKEKWVLTAAHCSDKNLTVVLGAHSCSKPEQDQQTFKVKQLIPHSCFDNETGVNDLMLLELDKAAKLKFVSILKLPAPFKDVKAKSQCRVAGWGTTNQKNNIASDILMEVNITVIDRRTCNEKKYYNFNPVITNEMLCAGDKRGKKNACQGDSGGPLICDNEFKAVKSDWPKSGCGKIPGVYTLLTTKHVQWIKKITGGDD
ncbi:granzyme A-like [Acipenser oxyrinchus oxyrinchus]|uniref:trypsin n=1 Tax=Acipenser oxyrinchus oxyrinchus TaxID=40147 RepID=A0AAD8LS95_ACIOX|nr:granzyme A-like [Acipenser oxyrinchus oxyrinchus]